MAVPNTFSPNTQIKSAQVNANFTHLTDIVDVSGSTNIFKSSTGARAYLSTGQTIANATNVKIQLDGKSYDIGNDFDNATNYGYLCRVDGYYDIHAVVGYNSPNSGSRYLAKIYIDSTQKSISSQTPNGTVAVYVPISDTIYCTAGQYIYLYANHNAGTDEALVNAEDSTYMSVKLAYAT